MNRKKVIYVGLLLIVTVISSVTYFSYAFFTSRSEQHGKLNIVTGTLKYKVTGSNIINGSITIPGNTTEKLELTLESLNDISSRYELYYETTSNNIEVGYSSDTEDATTGIIGSNGIKKIGVFVTNPTSSNITVTFNAEGGFAGNALVRTLGKAIPSQTSVCQNYGTHVFAFDYNGTDGSDGSVQNFVAPCTGIYTLETWGAQGGSSKVKAGNIITGGYGGYSVGNIVLNANSKYYIAVGGAGANSFTENISYLLGGYNGGGKSYLDNFASGGGLTHIATVPGELKDLAAYKDTAGTNVSNEIIIVAGGGGGSSADLRGGGNCFGGSAGGYKGNDGIPGNSSYGYGGVGGTQSSGYQFGMGFTTPDDYDNRASGGAGGWYGSYHGTNIHPNYARNTTFTACAGGGSSYIANPNLTNKAMYCYNCEESSETNTYTVSTTGNNALIDTTNCPDGYSSNPISKCAKVGNGYAKITYLSDSQIN